MEENKRDQNRRDKETLKKKKMKRRPKTRNRVFKRIILVIERNNLINMNAINFNRYRKNFYILSSKFFENVFSILNNATKKNV